MKKILIFVLLSVFLLCTAWILFAPSRVTLSVTQDGLPFSNSLVQIVRFNQSAISLGKTAKDGSLVWKRAGIGFQWIRVGQTVYRIFIPPSVSKQVVLPVAYQDDLYTLEVTVTDRDGNPVSGAGIIILEYAAESDPLIGYLMTDKTDANGKYCAPVHAGNHKILVDRFGADYKRLTSEYSLKPSEQKERYVKILYPSGA